MAFLIPVFLLCTSSSEQDNGYEPKTSAVNYRTYTYGKPVDSLESYSRLLSLYRNGYRNKYIAASLELCGNSFYLNGKYAKALEAYTMAMEMTDNSEDEKNIITCYYNIGNIYVIFKDYERAAHYYEKLQSSPIAKGKESTRSLAAIYLVMCYTRTNKKEAAEKALATTHRYPLSDKNIAKYYDCFCTGLVEELNGNVHKALKLQKQAYDLTEKYGMKIGMGAYPQSEMGRIFTAMGKPEKAIFHQRAAMELAKRDKAFDQLDDACTALDSLYLKTGKADSANFFRDIHLQLSASSLNSSEFYAARNKLINYEDEKTSRQIDKLKQRVNFLVVGLTVFLVVLAIIIFYSQKLRHAYKMLMLKNRQLINEQDENIRLKDEMAQSKNTKETDNELSRRIFEIMNDTDIICDKDFCLQTLATMTESNTKYVSAAINAIEQGGFKAVLNDNRIKEACRRLNDKKYAAYTIQAVAESVGYVSVNNFIIQFKKFTGMTPSVYRKMAQESEQDI